MQRNEVKQRAAIFFCQGLPAVHLARFLCGVEGIPWCICTSVLLGIPSISANSITRTHPCIKMRSYLYTISGCFGWIRMLSAHISLGPIKPSELRHCSVHPASCFKGSKVAPTCSICQRSPFRGLYFSFHFACSGSGDEILAPRKPFGT